MSKVTNAANSYADNYDALKFAKQFLFSKDDFSARLPNNFVKKNVFSDYYIFLHPWLKYNSLAKDETEIHLLGDAISSQNPQFKNEDIIKYLLSNISTFEDFENLIKYFSGRWIAIIKIGATLRFYNDAAGLKPLYYMLDDRRNIVVASQPSLIEIIGKTKNDFELIKEFESNPNPGYWPPQIIPFVNVRQMLPNHYLDVKNCATHRYWPVKSISNLSREKIIDEMFGLVVHFIDAVKARSNIVIPLTAGYDSRLLLAASKKYWPTIKFFTLSRPNIRAHDISIARKISRSLKLNYTYLSEKPDRELNNILLNNVGKMHYDLNAHYMNAGWIKIGRGNSVIPGTGGEMFRKFFMPNKNSPNNNKHISSPELLSLLGFKTEMPLAITEIDNWLSEFPEEFSMQLLDFAYWELRLGIRFALGQTLREGILDEFPVLNCRHLFDLGLKTSIEDRTNPYPLFVDLIRKGDSSLANIPFNHGWLDTLHEKTQGILPWRVRKLFR